MEAASFVKASIVLYIDADACPVKGEALRVAARHALPVRIVSNGGLRPNPDPMVETIIVPNTPDAADDWIVAQIKAEDICITNDIPLAGRCLEKGAHAIRPDGRRFTQNSIGSALATRSLMQDLREQGMVSGGPRPFSKADRSEFLNRLDPLVREALRNSARSKI